MTTGRQGQEGAAVPNFEPANPNRATSRLAGMSPQMSTYLPLAALAALLIGCSSQPIDSGPKPVVRTISILPASLPQYYSLQNLTAVEFLVPIVGLGYMLNAKEKAKLLTDRLPTPTFRIDEDLTSAVAESLRSKGYVVTVLADIERVPGDPDWFDYERVPHSTDALMHVYFSDVGVVSPRTTPNYLPRVNVSVIAYVPQNKSYPYETTLYYGIDAKAGTDYSVMADPKHSYPDFDFIVNNLDLVRSNIRASLNDIGQRIAEQAHAAFK